VREFLHGHCTATTTAARLHLSLRQFRRLCRRYQTEGTIGLQHRLTGRPSNNRTAAKHRQRILALVSNHYFDCGPTLAAELLAEHHQLQVHPETLRRWLRAAHFIGRRRKRRPYRRQRERKPAFGQMLQLDGSPHRWFGGTSVCLLNLIDDASSLNLCRFDHAETVRAACLLLWAWMTRHGIPQSIYCDRRNAYLSRDLEAADGLFGQLCRRLGILVIPAFSPQAKGRVERSNQTHQDRLIPQLRLHKVRTVEQANAFLPRYLAKHNHQFALDHLALPNLHRPLPNGATLDDYCFTETTRKIANDWTVQFNGKRYQLLPERTHCRAKTSLTVRLSFHCKLSFRHDDLPLQFKSLKS
jgi:transposase